MRLREPKLILFRVRTRGRDQSGFKRLDFCDDFGVMIEFMGGHDRQAAIGQLEGGDGKARDLIEP